MKSETDTHEQLAFYARSLDCVHCGLCLPACPTYDVLGLEPDSPRGRIYLMRAWAEGRLEDPQSVRVHLDQCLNCRACETACPSGVAYGQILESVRAEMEAVRPSRGIAARLRRGLLAHVVPRRRRLGLAFSVLRIAQALGLPRLANALGLLPAGAAALMPRVPPASRRRPLVGSFTPDGPARGRVFLFTGCVMEQLFGDINRQTLRLLLANGFAVEVPSAQTCCGALLVHDGQPEPARALAHRNLAAFAGPDPIVINSAGCGASMKEYGELLGSEEARAFGVRCQDVCEFLEQVGLSARPAPFPHRVAYDDPCHLCHAQGVQRQPRALLAEVPKLELIEHNGAERCCGSAGIYNLLQAELAAEIGRRKARDLAACGAEVIATGNPGCMLQIRAHLRGIQSRARVLHPVELLLPGEVRAR